MQTRSVLLAAAIAFMSAQPVHAQQTNQPMPGMAMPAPSQGGSGSSEGLTAANDKMMKDMDVELTGNADRDFVAMMMPHHQGAVDMAEVELKYGRDPELKKLARDIVAAQRKEIASMQKWQASHAQ